MADSCGARTKAGTPCKWPRDTCEFHSGSDRSAPQPGPRRDDSTPRRPAPDGRDLRELGWWVIESVLDGSLQANSASLIVSTMRVLASLGGADVPADEDALGEVALRARLVHGLAPADDTGWARAAEILDPKALEAVRRWGGGGDECIIV